MSMEATGTDAQVAEAWRRRAITAEDRVGHLERLLRSSREVLMESATPTGSRPVGWWTGLYRDQQRMVRRIDRALGDDS